MLAIIPSLLEMQNRAATSSSASANNADNGPSFNQVLASEVNGQTPAGSSASAASTSPASSPNSSTTASSAGSANSSTSAATSGSTLPVKKPGATKVSNNATQAQPAPSQTNEAAKEATALVNALASTGPDSGQSNGSAKSATTTSSGLEAIGSTSTTSTTSSVADSLSNNFVSDIKASVATNVASAEANNATNANAAENEADGNATSDSSNGANEASKFNVTSIVNANQTQAEQIPPAETNAMQSLNLFGANMAHAAKVMSAFSNATASTTNGSGVKTSISSSATPTINQTAVAPISDSAIKSAGLNTSRDVIQPNNGFATNMVSAQRSGAESDPKANSVESTTESETPASNIATANTLQLASNSSSDGNVSLQTIKSANQDLSTGQLNAIAPVLSTPSQTLSEQPGSSNTISPPVGSPNWDQAMGQKITWMMNGNQQSATLSLNPPELGPMQVVLNVNNQHANATFISHQPEVRAALENAIPKLREILGQSGIQLGECSVNSQSRQQDFAQQQSGSGTRSTQASNVGSTISSVQTSLPAIPRAGTGLVDTFV